MGSPNVNIDILLKVLASYCMKLMFLNKFWIDVVLIAVYLINRLPSPITNKKSPFQILHNKLPSYEHLKTFRCLYYPWIPPSQRTKLQPKGHQCAFLGYAHNQAYKCFNPIHPMIPTLSQDMFNSFQNIFSFQNNSPPPSPSLP